MKYNWQRPDWPNFTYKTDDLEEELSKFSLAVSRIGGILEALSESARNEVIIEMMVSEAVKTSEIEGEFLNREDVISSIKNNFGLPNEITSSGDLRAKGVGKLVVVVRKTFDSKLSNAMLYKWHKILMLGNRRVKVGAYRTHKEAMEIVSGGYGQQRVVHYEAPPSADVLKLMKNYVKWFNDTGPNGKHAIKSAPIRSAIAHHYFETIHPFEDGNGRIGRAIAEKALSQGVGSPVLLSLSSAITLKKKNYYDALSQGQKSCDMTSWVKYFVALVTQAQEHANKQIDFTLNKAKFYDTYKNEMSARQLKVIERVLKEGVKGFDGGLSSKNYSTITKVSKNTAVRDIQDLIDKGILSVMAGGSGKLTRYQINFKT